MKRSERDKICRELERLTANNGGVLTPEIVVSTAESPNSILHSLFEWDDGKAGHQWRINQARELIRAVKVVVNTEKTAVSVVCYVQNPDKLPSEQGYVPVLDLVGDEERCRAVLLMEMGRVLAALERARTLSDVFDLREEIESVEARVSALALRIKNFRLSP